MKDWISKHPVLLLYFVILLGYAGFKLYNAPPKPTVETRLSAAEAKSAAAINVRMKPVSDLFAKGRYGSQAFASEALSWSGKWELVKGMVNNRDSHRRYLADEFSRHVFTQDELQKAMEAAARMYLDDLEAFESELLVQLRADLANAEVKLPHVHSDKEFQAEYRRLSGLVSKRLNQELGVTVGREIGSTVAAGIATQAAIKAAQAAAAELGISAGILGTGTASSVVTLGVGIVVALVIDAILDEVLRFAGFDPEENIKSIVCQSINNLEAALIGPKGKLRLQLEEIHQARAKVRNEAIRQLLKGAQP